MSFIFLWKPFVMPLDQEKRHSHTRVIHTRLV